MTEDLQLVSVGWIFWQFFVVMDIPAQCLIMFENGKSPVIVCLLFCLMLIFFITIFFCL
jgi:hypothetical protein